MKIKELPKKKQRQDTLRKLQKKCAICGKAIAIFVNQKGEYTGGNYFGKIPIRSKAELDRSLAAGTRVVRIHGKKFNVLKSDPKPYRYVEYWECRKCYKG